MATEKYYHLIFKQLTEGLSSSEASQLRAWLAESADNRQAATEIETIFNASAQEIPSADIPTELAALKKRLRAEASTNPELEVTHRAPKRWWWAVAASLLVLVAAVFALRETSSPAAKWVTIASATQQNQLVNLPDGSRVWLNNNSEISYIKNVDQQSERQVKLTGEAFFEVAKDPAKPFEVQTDGCQVRVLGTSFNVRAKPSEPSVEVAVRTGRVQVSTSTDIAELLPGQQAVADKKTQRLKLSTQAKGDIAEWRAAEMAFQNLPLRSVARRLSRRFDQTVEIKNSNLLDCPYSAYFPEAKLEEILTNLQAVFGVNIEKTDHGLRLLGGHCPR